MPQTIATFDPNSSTTGTFPIYLPNNVGKVVVWNKSNVALTLSWAGETPHCPAWTGMAYIIAAPSIEIGWKQHSILSTNGNPISQVVVEVYNSQEPFLGVFPVPLHYQTNIGNAQAVSSSTSNLINDGNVAGTQIIESTPTGAASSTISVLNDGTVLINADVGGVLTQLIKTVANPVGNNANVILSDANHHAKVIGFLEVDGGTVNILGSNLGHVSGNGGGTATFYMDMQGLVQRLTIVFVGFLQITTNATGFALPAPFTTAAQFVAGYVPPLEAHLGAGSAINASVVNGFGTSIPQNNFGAFTWGDIPASFDTIIIRATSPFVAPFNGVITFTGV